MMRRRRPLVRAAVVGGTAYYAGKKVSQGRQAEADQEARIADLEAQQAEQQDAAPAPAAEAPAADGGLADEIAKLKSLLDSGALTQDEFDAAKQRIIAGG
jgi:membrane protease subunit (stomatin/prohibitin family)